jgi:excisionase family DNA binding protein
MTNSENAQLEQTQASEARQKISALLHEHTERDAHIYLRHDNETIPLELSREALEAFRDILAVLERGGEVEVVKKDRELTTREAADLLNVSRPHLVELLESGEIPFHKVGTHRRVRLEDLLTYKQARKQKSREHLKALAEEDERLDLDY